MRTFRSPDGVPWGVEVMMPGSSNAMIVFRHPGGRTARLDRYNWVITHGPESHNVTARLDPDEVLRSLSERDIARLFRRSFLISRLGQPGPGLATGAT